MSSNGLQQLNEVVPHCSNTANTRNYFQFDLQCDPSDDKPEEIIVSKSQSSESSRATVKDLKLHIEMESTSSNVSSSSEETPREHSADILEPQSVHNGNMYITECKETAFGGQSTQCILKTHGYIYSRKLAKTLQGEVFEAIHTKNIHQMVVIKKAIKSLVNQRITIRNNKQVKIDENIWREIEIMKYLDSFENAHVENVLPKQHIKLLQVFEDNETLYLVTEHGGIDFFEWVSKAHKRIQSGQLAIRYWWKNIKFLFKQMVDYVLWLHTTMNVCHLDLSLENLLLQNGEYFYQTGKFSWCQQIKFCDFGLSEYFNTSTNPSFECNKHVGKESYMAPEVHAKTNSFDARQADSWSLGVILFIMMTGAPAYSQPDLIKDESFQYIVCGKIPLLLSNWKRLHYVHPLMMDLLQKIFILDPNQRYTVQQIRNHPLLQS